MRTFAGWTIIAVAAMSLLWMATHEKTLSDIEQLRLVDKAGLDARVEAVRQAEFIRAHTAKVEAPPTLGYVDAEDNEQPVLALKPEESVTYDDMENEQWKIEVTAEQPVTISGPCGDSTSVLHETYKCDKGGEFSVTDSRTNNAGLFASLAGAIGHSSKASERMYFPNRVTLRFSYWQCIANCPK